MVINSKLKMMVVGSQSNKWPKGIFDNLMFMVIQYHLCPLPVRLLRDNCIATVLSLIEAHNQLQLLIFHL